MGGRVCWMARAQERLSSSPVELDAIRVGLRCIDRAGVGWVLDTIHDHLGVLVGQPPIKSGNPHIVLVRVAVGTAQRSTQVATAAEQ